MLAPRKGFFIRLLYGLGAIALPPVVLLPGLLIDQGLHPFWPWFFFSLALTTGCFCAMSTVDAWPVKVLVGGLYLPFCFVALAIFAFDFVGSVYGRWL